MELKRYRLLLNNLGGEVSVNWIELMWEQKGQSTGHIIITDNEWKFISVLNDRKLSFRLLSKVSIWQQLLTSLLRLITSDVFPCLDAFMHIPHFLLTEAEPFILQKWIVSGSPVVETRNNMQNDNMIILFVIFENVNLNSLIIKHKNKKNVPSSANYLRGFPL